MKSNRIKIIKSRRLKSKKYKRKTRVRLHLGKNKQIGGARCEIDFSDNRDTLYVKYISHSFGKNYLYKINLGDKTFEIYEPEHGYISAHPLKEITRNIRSAILKTMNKSNCAEKQKIMNIFIEHDIDPLLPMKISPLSDSTSSSALPA